MTEEMPELITFPSVPTGTKESPASHLTLPGMAWPVLAASWLAILTLGQPQVRAGDARKAEYELKATYLCKVANFVGWPTNGTPTANDAFVLGILGDDAFGDTFERAIDNHTIQDRQLVIRRGKDIADFKSCHILFISETEKERLAQIFESLKGASVLTVGEGEHFCQSGGMINLKPAGQNPRFEVNPVAAERANLKISSQLLKLATIRRDAGKEEN